MGAVLALLGGFFGAKTGLGIVSLGVLMRAFSENGGALLQMYIMGGWIFVGVGLAVFVAACVVLVTGRGSWAVMICEGAWVLGLGLHAIVWARFAAAYGTAVVYETLIWFGLPLVPATILMAVSAWFLLRWVRLPPHLRSPAAGPARNRPEPPPWRSRAGGWYLLAFVLGALAAVLGASVGASSALGVVLDAADPHPPPSQVPASYGWVGIALLAGVVAGTALAPIHRAWVALVAACSPAWYILALAFRALDGREGVFIDGFHIWYAYTSAGLVAVGSVLLWFGVRPGSPAVARRQRA